MEINTRRLKWIYGYNQTLEGLKLLKLKKQVTTLFVIIRP